jgi:hypothetical protein
MLGRPMLFSLGETHDITLPAFVGAVSDCRRITRFLAAETTLLGSWNETEKPER